MNLHVLQSNAFYRLYHAIGYSNMLESFLFQCNTLRVCTIATRIPPSWNLGVQAIGHRQNAIGRVYVMLTDEFEYQIHQWCTSKVSSIEMSEDAILKKVSQERNQQTGAFLRKYDIRNPVFFQE